VVDDCIHREDKWCKKRKKHVAIDARNKDEGLTCWDKLYCEDFDCLRHIMERKEKEAYEKELEKQGEEQPVKVEKEEKKESEVKKSGQQPLF